MSSPSTTSPAATGRSILARPGRVCLELDGGVRLESAGVQLGEHDGAPRFSCPVGSGLASYAERGLGAVLRLDSRSDVAEPEQTLTLAGPLALRDVEACECCQEVRHVVDLELDFVLLTSWTRVGGRRFVVGRPERLDVPEFRDARHALNEGYLLAAAEHANDCHQDELRRAVAARTHTSMASVLAVQLTGLTPRAVDVAWVDTLGGHRTRVTFPRPAKDPAELTTALCTRLGLSTC